MTFKDSLNNTFAALGRFCTGVVNDGDTVKFANAWDVVPTVFLFPIQLQTSTVGYENVNIWQHIEPLNVSKEGFSVSCQSVLRGGSGGNFVINHQFADWDGANGNDKWYSYTLNLPANISKISVTCKMTGECYTSREDTGDSDGHEYVDDSNYTTFYLQWRVDGKIVVPKYEAWTYFGEIRYQYTTGDANETKTLYLNNNSTITCEVCFHGESKYNSSPHGSEGRVSIVSYTCNTSSDMVIAHGTAGFIAIDPNSCPYTVTKG